MEEKIYIICQKINKLYKENPEFKQLENCEKKLEEDDEVIKLSYKKDICCCKYSDALKVFSENSIEVKNALKELNNAKTELDNNTVVRDYLKHYANVKKLMFEMNKIIFADIFNQECL